MHVTFDDLKELLGNPKFLCSDPCPWNDLEGDLGFHFPGDYKRFVDAYGAVLINEQLTIYHPATVWYNLGEEIREELDLWSDIEEELRPPHPMEASPGGLIPWGYSASSETAYFRVPRDDSEEWVIAVIEREEFEYHEYPMTFNEWMLSYLRGEEMAICSRNFAPGRPFLRELPQPGGVGSVQ